MTIRLSTGWGTEVDIARLLELADIATAEGLIDDAAQLVQAAEDITVQSVYVDDLERILGGAGNPYTGISTDIEFAVACSATLIPGTPTPYHHH